MEWGSILNEGFIGSVKSVFKMAYIVIPLMILMELAKEAKLLDKVVAPVKPLARAVGLSESAAFPLVVGTVFGLAYGAGFIIDYVEQGILSKQENYLLNVFLSIFHAAVEDTLLFLVIGAKFGVILGGRLLVAIIITRVVSFVFVRRAVSGQSS